MPVKPGGFVCDHCRTFMPFPISRPLPVGWVERMIQDYNDKGEYFASALYFCCENCETQFWKNADETKEKL